MIVPTTHGTFPSCRDSMRGGFNERTQARADWLTTDTHKANTTSIAYIAGANHYLWNHVKIGLDAGAQHDPGTETRPMTWSSVFFAQVMIFF